MTYLKNTRGVSLTELLIVVAIFGILVIALGFSYQGWMGAYKVESQIKQFYVDMMNARTLSMQTNRVHSINMTTTEYNMFEDLNGDGAAESAIWSTSRSKTGSAAGAAAFEHDFNAAATYAFTTRGIANNTGTVCINADVDSDYDCMEISATRIVMGKLTTRMADGGACSEANCVAK